MNRKIFKIVLAAVLVCGISPVFGRLRVGLRFNRTRYMQYEHIYACVTIRNDSGKPLLFGSRPELQGFVVFDVRDKSDRLIPRRKGMEISVQGLYLAPGEIKNMVIPLHRYYDLRKEGIYYVHASVSHNKLPREYHSSAQPLRISGGSVLWERTVGLPDKSADTSDETERTYSICKVEGDQRVKYYYLRVENDRRVYAVTRLGVVQSHMDFQAQVDMLSRLHLLIPVAPKIYHYMSFNSDGALLENSYWKVFGTVPMLYRNPKTGQVTRMGGEPAKEGVDYDDPKKGSLTVAEILDGDNNSKPAPRKDGGVVDLGEGLMPVKAADED